MGLDWLIPDWPAPPRVRARITTRKGGESRHRYASFNLGLGVGDDPQLVLNNRDRLRTGLPDEPLWLRQVHGATVVEAESAGREPCADGAVTSSPKIVLVVLTADCLPVLICDHEGGAVGAVHAGWRGLAAGVIESAVGRIGVAPSRLMAYLGPGISAAAYEVGPEVREAFVSGDPRAARAFADGKPGKYFADLCLLARQRLEKAGIMDVYGGNYCTYADRERFFSHRRDGETGRMASLIWLQDS